ncbi:MAG: GNAT family N-acetyltransferase, partial [Pseudomonadota bacterium]
GPPWLWAAKTPHKIVPVLDDRRRPPLTLRPFADTPSRDFVPLANNPAVARMTARMPVPYLYRDAMQFKASLHPGIRRSENAFALWWDKTCVGCVGFSAAEGHTELGYWIGEPYWGRGFATAGARAVIAYGHQRLGLTRWEAGYFLDNPASGRVLTKIGFRPSEENRRFSAGRCAITPHRSMILEVKRPRAGARP